MALTNRTTIPDVHRVKRPGIGFVYTGRITIGDLGDALKEGLVQYAPKYQRGYKPKLNMGTPEPDVLLKIDARELNIDETRATQMAAKYLMASGGYGDKKLFNPNIMWNARKDPRRPDPLYDEATRTLEIATTITIPDSGHRHYSYMLLNRWKEEPDRIPDPVSVETDGETVTAAQLYKWVKNLDLYDPDECSILVEIVNLSRDDEGHLFDEYNTDAKSPSLGVSINLNPQKDPSRRFVYRLMSNCDIFGPTEIETQVGTIGSKSRKLTTNSTMAPAIKPIAKHLFKLEERDANGNLKRPGDMDDLVDFFCAFFHEWAKHYPEYLPTAKADERHDLRRRSFALSNIMFFPLFQLAWDFWSSYNEDGVDWHTEKGWTECLARLAGDTMVELPDGTKRSVPIMSRDVWSRRDDGTWDITEPGNPAWHGKILIEKFSAEGKSAGWSLSSTRQTRDAAYKYIRSVGLEDS